MALDPGSIVCKFATAGEMVCSQVQVQAGSVATFLDKWQSLLGAFLGAIIGILGALIVARSAIKRGRALAVLLLLPDLRQYMLYGEAVEKDLQDPENLGRSRVKVASIKHRRPMFERLHGAEISQVLDIDHRLWAHLMHCQGLDKKLPVELEKYDRMEKDAIAAGKTVDDLERAISSDSYRRKVQSDRDRAFTRLSERTASVENTFDLCVEHATLANYFIGQFMFARWYRPAPIVRWRMRFKPNEYDLRSAYLIKEQAILFTES